MHLGSPSRPGVAALLSPGTCLTWLRSPWRGGVASCVFYSSGAATRVDLRGQLVPHAAAAAAALQQLSTVHSQAQTHFFSSESFEGLGLCGDVSAALTRAGFTRPAQAQVWNMDLLWLL